MKIILTHIGLKPLPSYINLTIKQIRKFNPDLDIIFITNQYNFNILTAVDDKLILVDAETLVNDKIYEILALTGRSFDDFWSVTITRILYIEEYLRINNDVDIIHFENDVLIYFNIKDYEDVMKTTFNSLAITNGGYDRMMTGFFYIKNHKSLQHMTDFWIELLKHNTFEVLKSGFGIDMIHEMALLFIYGKIFDTDYLNYFPILPQGKHSINLEVFNSLFDPASYGQYLGGTNSEKIPGFLDTNHYIGREIYNNMIDYSITFENHQPYLKYKINNLHVHSKNLINFI